MSRRIPSGIQSGVGPLCCRYRDTVQPSYPGACTVRNTVWPPGTSGSSSSNSVCVSALSRRFFGSRSVNRSIGSTT